MKIIESGDDVDEKEIYFMILKQKKEKEMYDNLNFTSKIKPKIIYEKRIAKENGVYIDHLVYKFNLRENGNKEQEETPLNNYQINYKEGNNNYVISFSVKNNSFIYDLELKKVGYFFDDITEETFDQNIIPLYYKLNIFIEALKKNNQNEEIEKLYEDTIELYENKKYFSLLISLFIKTYSQNKNLCSKLLAIFNKINEKDNKDNIYSLGSEIEKFNIIFSEADNIIKNNEYDPVNFYGVLLSYFNYYDINNNFLKYIKKLYENNPELLYEILIAYYSSFNRPLNQDLDFYDNFIEYIFNKNIECDIFEKVLFYFNDLDIESFLYIINKNKERIIKKYDEHRFKPIIINDNLKLIKKENSKEIENINKLVEELINCSKEKNSLLINLKSTFWMNLIEEYNKPDLININNCYILRLLFKKYNDLINILYKEITNDNNDRNYIIKNDINKYCSKDEFSYILNKNIKVYCEIKKGKLTHSEILGIFIKFNPYYNIENKEDFEKYKNNRETYIFDYINFHSITPNFKKTFHNLNFETIFKDNINEFINKITSKIEDITTFGNIIDLIDTSRIKDNIKDYYNIFKDKYELIIKYEITSFKNEDKLIEAIKILCKFISMISLEEKNNYFLEEKISRLDDKIKLLIYHELIKTYKDEKYESMKQSIYDIIINKLNGIDNIIKLIDNLENEDKNIFIKKILDKCIFTKEEFYSNDDNNKIKLLCELNERGKLIIPDIYSCQLAMILDDIRRDIDSGIITKKVLESFLGEGEKKCNKKDLIINKLGLLKLILRNFDQIKKYDELKLINANINETIERLMYIKNSLVIYNKNKYLYEIKKIITIIDKLETKPIREFKTEKMNIESLLRLKVISDEVNKVKDFLFFKEIYAHSQGLDDSERFDDGIRRLKEIKKLFLENSSNIEKIYEKRECYDIFNNIKNELSKKDEYIIDKFITQMIEYFEIKDKHTILDLEILIKSKKYEVIIKSIKYFFDCLNKKLVLPTYLYLSIMNLTKIKLVLKELRDKNIYDYQSKNFYYKIFTSFYEKREAIDFLLSKIDIDLKQSLQYKLDPYNKNISIKDIDDTNECLLHFKSIINMKSQEILYYIKHLDEDIINKFINYSSHYNFIIELDRKNTKNIFEDIYKIIEDANIKIEIDKEDIFYIVDGEYLTTNLENLINLKNKINIPEKSLEKNENKETKEKDIYEIQIDKLFFFKEIISKLEVIYDKIVILRTKGCCLPLSIIIKIRYPISEIYLNNDMKNFDEIKNYLSNVLYDYEHQLNIIYQDEKYIRFLYGNLFRKIKKYQICKYDISGIIRYILNKINSNDLIEDADIYDINKTEDYFNEYHEYNKNTFNNISQYLVSLFNNNNLDIRKHYNNILIKEPKNLKGIYIEQCRNISMEEYIFNLYQENLEMLPIAQNILICSNETSFEEIQSFLYRAILCKYNTLFVIEIIESFSKIQQNKMCNCINKILSYKYEKYISNNKENENTNKLNPREYLNSCIFFIYRYSNNDFTYLNELSGEKYQRRESKVDKNDDSNNSDISDNIKNNDMLKKIKVISSDICGLGKSFKIKKMIKSENKCYYHFPLGGILTKKIIFEKLFNLLNRIRKDASSKNKNEEKYFEKSENINYSNIAIHLDLLETRDISLINEFLFSFLITKFYIYNGDIIYIPSDIQIYIEIPNSSDNYLVKYGILNIFNIENIILGEIKPKETKNINNINNIPMLHLDLEINIKQIFSRMIGMEKLDDIEKFIKENIDIKEYSYHQIHIFIKIFISQFIKFKGKILLQDSKGENINNELIKYISESTKYFTNGRFAKLIFEKNNYFYDNNFEPDRDEWNSKYFETPLVFIDINKKKVSIQSLSNKKVFNDKNSGNPSYKFLKQLKQIFCLQNDIEKNEGDNKSLLSILNSDNNNYTITEDNFRKMILLLYRIQANIPVIIMGETGCGKTILIKKLNQLLNNGKELLEIINIHTGVTDEIISKFMDEINNKAKNINELWILFDEINTCPSFSLITEIFINRTYNGKQLVDNIRLIGTCNPFRLKRSSDEDYDRLVYPVNQLPQSLFYYIFNFGEIYNEDEKIYIYNIIQKLFEKDDEKLHHLTTDAISKCHKFLRANCQNDPSIVSLRDISRFIKIVEFFQDYYQKKNDSHTMNDDKKKLYKIKSIICSIYLCYYIRLDDKKRRIFECELQDTLLKIVNVYSDKDEDEKEERYYNLFDRIKYDRLKRDLREFKFNCFSDLLKSEENFLRHQIEIERGIGKNEILKENLFLLFISIITKIPLIIVGKPGTSKTLCTQLIYNSMRGKYSKSEFFKKYPQIIQTYFKGSYSTKPEDITNLFNEVENSIIQNKLNNNYKDIINMIVFDQIDLAYRATSNPLLILNNKIEFYNKNENISFIGISNLALDAKKMNKTLYLSVPNLEDNINQLIVTYKDIVRDISDDIREYLIFNILSRSYFQYKYYLYFIKKMIVLRQYIQRNGIGKVKGKDFREIERDREYIKLLKKERKINLDFHGNRDFYNLIKGVAIDGSKLNNISEIVYIINYYIERNFGGINYEINIDFDLEFNDINCEMERLKRIFYDIMPIGKKNEDDDIKENLDSEDNIIKISSVYLFKKIYNESCTLENDNGIKGEIYRIKYDDINKCNINRCINGNMNDNNSRHLLLEIKPNLAPLIIQNIKIRNPDVKDVVYFNESPFLDDNNNQNKFKQINEIVKCVSKKDNIVIIQNLSILPYLYDLFDKNYQIIDGQKFIKIYLENIGEQLMPIDGSSKIIILVDKNRVNSFDTAFLNRFEKVEIDFIDLLDYRGRNISIEISEKIRLKEEINLIEPKINYKLNNLLINCDMENIAGLVNYLLIENKMENINRNEIIDKIYRIINNILPQDIIIHLNVNNPINCHEKKYYDLKEYIKDLEMSRKNEHKISIIYTFSKNIEEYNNINGIILAEIETENKLKYTIDNIKNEKRNGKKNKNIIIINFEQSDLNKMEYICDLINNNYKDDDYNYIFIIHIQRNFGDERKIIYSLPNIYKNINQLFIDNLQGPNISLKELMCNNIKDVIDLYPNLDNIFKKVLVKFINEEMNENNNNEIIDINNISNSEEDKYINEMKNYFKNDNEFRHDLIEKAKELIKEEVMAHEDMRNLVDEIFESNYINKKNIDIVSSILDYISENIIGKILWKIFKALKDNNILKELIDNVSDKNKIDELKSKALKLIMLNKEKK